MANKTGAVMRCMECGEEAIRSFDPLDVQFEGHALTLHDIPHSVCPACGEICFSSDDIDVYYEAIVAAYREKEMPSNDCQPFH